MPDDAYNEAYRPQFHFTARENWLNDPNGLVFYRGKYHLFFQHNPSGRDWGNMTWGHAVSTDLVHWQQLPNALEPDDLGTMFSGSAVVDWDNTAGLRSGDDETVVVLYTAAGDTSPESAGQPHTQCLAYSNDGGRTLTKLGANPVLGHVAGNNRDPKVVWHEPSRRWIMALYLKDYDFAFFSSPDLKNWQHLHDITAPGCDECPDFFELAVDGDEGNRKWVWTAANGHYLVGSFDGERFEPEGGGPFVADWGANYYAVQTYSDIPKSDGRRIQIAWMRDGEYPGMPFNQQMSFPCELRLRSTPEGPRLHRTPVQEIETLYAGLHSWKDLVLAPGENPLSEIRGDLFDLRAVLEPVDAAEVGFRIRGEAVSYNASNRELSCLGRSAPLAPTEGRIEIRILVDRTSLEVFGNEGRVSMTSCFVPDLEDRSLEIYARGGTAKIASLEVRELRSAWSQAPPTEDWGATYEGGET